MRSCRLGSGVGPPAAVFAAGLAVPPAADSLALGSVALVAVGLVSSVSAFARRDRVGSETLGMRIRGERDLSSAIAGILNRPRRARARTIPHPSEQSKLVKE